jgi:hypothetical protein
MQRTTDVVITNKASIPALQKRNPTMSIHRSAITRYAALAAAAAGAIALSTSGASSAFAAQSGTIQRGFAPTEECLNWTGTIQAYPTLTKTAHGVTEVISGTLNNCSFLGTPQTYSGTFFGVLTGSASNKAATLSGNVAVTWPADAGLSPTISPISVNGTSNVYSLFGTISAGTTTGEQLEGSYDVVSHTSGNGTTTQNLVSTGAFGVFVNEG